MSNKVFTLIHGDAVHLAPNARVIKAKAFSTLLTAKEMLKKVKEDADKYVSKVTEESETIKERAYKEGFEAGFQEWADQIARLEGEIAKVHDEVHKLIIPVALNAAKKIVGREMELHPEAVLDIVKNKLKAAVQYSKIKIYANKADLQILEKSKDNLKKMFELLESLTLVEKNDITPGGCIIETEGGIINAQLENQWEILERAFNKIMGKQNGE